MKRRKLGTTDLELPILGFGASSIGAEFGQRDLQQSLSSAHAAIDAGLNYIDTAPYYGRAMSEVLLGFILPKYKREDLILSTKIGRYGPNHFDFSAKRVAESTDLSLERMQVEYIDMVFCHDIEYGDLNQVIDETLPALRRQVEKGKVRYIGISGYPMKIFKTIIPTGAIDCALTYNHYNLQNDMAQQLVPLAEKHNVGMINAAPFSARLLTHMPLPPWHKATDEVRRVAKEAVDFCRSQGTHIEKLALQFSLANPSFSSCLVGSARMDEIQQWLTWMDEPMDLQLIAQVQEILKPIHNWFYVEGRPENNDLDWPTSTIWKPKS
jgi:aryl-alcohol dehydrogenase-like predicted oxidoreductase